mmetsp:Transcript_59328/g.111153  ORF Transcript_59328/g.111153 Transcript_59328/m.111153 type:complete len:189 (-) Transcript_59328:63-629(-)
MVSARIALVLVSQWTTCAGVSPSLLRSVHEAAVKGDGAIQVREVQIEKMRQMEGSLFGNCSAAAVTAVAEVSDCTELDVRNCSSSFVLLNGVKSVCAVRGEQCVERGDAFCCLSLGAAQLCNRKYMKAQLQVPSCAAEKRPARCSRAYEKHLVHDPGDRAIIVKCAYDAGTCVGRASPLTELACCKKW